MISVPVGCTCERYLFCREFGIYTMGMYSAWRWWKTPSTQARSIILILFMLAKYWDKHSIFVSDVTSIIQKVDMILDPVLLDK